MTQHFSILFKISWKQFKNRFRLLMRRGRLRLATIVFTLLIIWVGLFWGFYRGFIFLGAFLGVGEILIDRLIYLLSLALFLMLIFSNAVISFQFHYKARETSYLKTLPLSPSIIFWFLSLETVFLSTWATLFLIFPVALAYGITHNLPLYSYLAFPIFGLCLAALAAMLGILLTALITRIISLSRLKAILITLLVLIAFFMIFRARFPSSPPPTSNQQTQYINKLLKHTRLTLNPLFPSFWAAEGFLQSIKGRPRRGLGFLAVLMVNALFVWQVVDLSAGNFYHRTWCLYHSRGRRKQRKRLISRGQPSRFIFFFLPSSIRALLIKDFKIFIREPAQWLQGAILFGLLTIYIINIKNMPANVYQPFWKNLITFFNLGTSSLILATLTTRFVFPSLSLEGKTFWVLGLAPLDRAAIFRAKSVSNIIGALVITEALMLLSNHILEVSGLMTWVTCSAIFFMSLVLVSLAMGMGAVFADLKQDNPARIASGFGGTLNLILSLAYIVIVVGVLALAFHLKTTRPFAGTSYGAGLISGGIIVLILLTFLGIYLPWKLGTKALRRLEF